MKEHPILFSAPMVRAILAGNKTQTRRIVKPQWAADVIDIAENPAQDPVHGWMVSGHSGVWCDCHSLNEWRVCPFGKPGDRLWVKETFTVYNINDSDMELGYVASPKTVRHLAPCSDDVPDAALPLYFKMLDKAGDFNKRLTYPSIFMPRWASRITLDITGVRVERLQDISEADARAEGVTLQGGQGYDGWAKAEYMALWESINGPGSWATNPWVWVVEFKRIDGNDPFLT